MRSVTRAVATAVTALAFSAGALVTAAPAAAGPGEGCAGLPETPEAYVCVVSLTPTDGLPGVGTSPLPVRVPPVCYLAGCTEAMVVDVPVPYTTEPQGYVAVLWYQGTYYPIGIGLDGVWQMVEDVQILADDVVAFVGRTIGKLPSTDELVARVIAEVEKAREHQYCLC